MKTVSALRFVAVGLVTLGISSGAQAATITTLFDTGVNASGNPLADGTIGDPHYQIVSVPGGTTDIRVRTSAGGYPVPPYVGDDALSAWIGPNNDGAVDGPPGNYDYRTTFDLTGFNSSTASITGGWSSDNNGVAILLNGVNTGNPGTSFTQFSAGFAPFSITSGFNSGVNTLDFIVFNGADYNNPTALRTEMTGAADLAPVPEPTSMFLLGTGLVGGAVRRWRRSRASV